ncbi:hypothetical protein [Agromyces marinus]|uniref:Uncharacterized protein n=1 Tax=Agromyces marinus TaxID=1389020 RepID=A0ABN6YEU0_9MICO|nr:hypothetical protein [Agromyces marinus]UIP57900.1 hypothetical protein DSM26151_07670 [Agromyces marinus]BDZ53903.1 hypothetical protein GCM10025870_09760 [Agromyces marinus]
MTQLARFFAHLKAVDSRNSGDLERESVMIWCMPGELVPFKVSADELAAALPTIESDSRSLWPDVPPELAAFRLLSIHMMEHAESGKPRGERGYQLQSGLFVPWS